MRADDDLARVKQAIAGPRAKKFGYSVLGTVAVVVLLYLAVQMYGPLNALAYVFTFLFCATFFPTLITLLGNGVPLSTSIGRLHILLGAIAFNYHYLVQRDNKWEWCPGKRGKVHIDGQWHKVKGEDNYSILGWRPFGIVRYKDSETWADKRADTKAESVRGQHIADGGAGEVIERGGFKEAEKPLISGTNGTWLLDLKRVCTHGVKKIGDIELIETAEEIIERGQVKDSKFEGWKPFIETGAGLLFGVISGYIYLFVS